VYVVKTLGQPQNCISSRSDAIKKVQSATICGHALDLKANRTWEIFQLPLMSSGGARQLSPRSAERAQRHANENMFACNQQVFVSGVNKICAFAYADQLDLLIHLHSNPASATLSSRQTSSILKLPARKLSSPDQFPRQTSPIIERFICEPVSIHVPVSGCGEGG